MYSWKVRREHEGQPRVRMQHLASGGSGRTLIWIMGIVCLSLA